MNKYYECPNAFADIKRLLGCTEVFGVIDAGAHEGAFTVGLSSQFPDLTVIAFEPHPETFDRLVAKTGSMTNIRCERAALSSETGKRNFFLSRLSYTSSLLPRPSQGKRYFPTEADHEGLAEVDVWSLDEWLAAHSPKFSVDLIKADVQGSELQLLKGARGTLQKGVKLIYAEVQFVPLYEGANSYIELAAYLHELGFDLYQFYDLVVSDDGQLVYGDAIFISGELRRKAI